MSRKRIQNNSRLSGPIETRVTITPPWVHIGDLFINCDANEEQYWERRLEGRACISTKIISRCQFQKTRVVADIPVVSYVRMTRDEVNLIPFYNEALI